MYEDIAKSHGSILRWRATVKLADSRGDILDIPIASDLRVGSETRPDYTPDQPLVVACGSFIPAMPKKEEKFASRQNSSQWISAS